MPKVNDEYSEKRKKNIAKKARDVFVRKGYSSVAMKDIMEEVKISRGGIYAHFNNVEDVFLATLQYDDVEQSSKISMPNQEMPLLPQLLSWVHNVLIFAQNEKVSLVRAKSEFFLSHDILEIPFLKERYEKLLQNIQVFIVLGIEKKEFRSDIDIITFSELIVSMLDGVVLNRYYQYNSETVFSNMYNLIEEIITATLVLRSEK